MDSDEIDVGRRSLWCCWMIAMIAAALVIILLSTHLTS